MLTYIETTLGSHWAEYDGYKELEARNANMAKLLKAQGNKMDHGEIYTYILFMNVSFFQSLIFCMSTDPD